jgi:hypothetical protein
VMRKCCFVLRRWRARSFFLAYEPFHQPTSRRVSLPTGVDCVTRQDVSSSSTGLKRRTVGEASTYPEWVYFLSIWHCRDGPVLSEKKNKSYDIRWQIV